MIKKIIPVLLLIVSKKLFSQPVMEFHNIPEFEKDIQLTNDQRRNLLLITKELVHNAVKYSQAKNIILQASMLHDDFIVSVKDDGDGFDEATVKHGNGIRNMRQRIPELGGHLTISSKAAYGTHGKFSVTIN